jgi:hypothetical protein
MFKEGQRHGQGALYYSSGARYEGQWQQGKKHGQGVYVFEDGHVFSGQFMDDRPVLATGAVLGADSTFTMQEAAWGSCLGLGASSKRSNSKQQQQQELAAEPGEALQRVQARSSSDASGGEPVPTAGVAAASSSEPKPSPAAAVASKGASKSGKQLVKASGTTGAAKPGSAASKATPSKSGGPQSTSVTASGAGTAAPAKRVSSAGSAASATSAATGKPSTAESQAAGGSAVSTSSGPCFGPAMCVMQLYIADLLQCYEGQPEAVYKPVSNLLVGYNTELRLLYDKYRWGGWASGHCSECGAVGTALPVV